MIAEVVRFQDDTVLVVDENCHRMSEFEGRYQDVRVKILARAPKGAKFFHGLLVPFQGRYHDFPCARKDW